MTHANQASRKLMMVAGATAASVIPACGVTGLYPPPTEVPSVLAAAGDDWNAYALRLVTDPLDDVVAGTVMDDLEGLDGCWASVERFGVVSRDGLSGMQLLFYDLFIGIAGPNPAGDWLHVYEFDMTNGTFTGWSWVSGSRGKGPIYAGRGPIIIQENNRVTLVTQETYDSHDEEGQLVENPEFRPREFGDSTSHVLITLSGDWLKFDRTPEGGKLNDESVQTFKRFACPTD